jgi:hypothetical protein
MPNWCACSLLIKGSSSDLNEFYETLNTSNGREDIVYFSFHQTVPRPDGSDWYSWNNENWGTKWDASDVDVITRTHTKFLVRFNTAWSPPLSWLESVSSSFPQLTFRISYCESGMQFYGTQERCKSKGESHSDQYGFLDDDLIELEDSYEVNPNGRLSNFMSIYSLVSIGG